MAYLIAYRRVVLLLNAVPSLPLPLCGPSRSLELFSRWSALAPWLTHPLAAAGLNAISLGVDVGV